MTPLEYFEAGQLTQAVEAALQAVKKDPVDLSKRMFLCQMLAFSGDLERADKQLDLLMTQSPDAVLGVAEFRQLLRAEMARTEFYKQGRVPEFLGEPTETQKLQLQASIAIRENDYPAAKTLLDQAGDAGDTIEGVCNESPFQGFRDLDDLLGTTVEVLTSTGKYYWIPAERITDMTFLETESYHQLLWRRAEIRVVDGPEGIVHLPVVYGNQNVSCDDQARLGRMTDWHELKDGPILGIGQKTWLIGDQDCPLMDIQTFSAALQSA